MMTKPKTLSELIANKAVSNPDLEIVTFVTVEPDGKLSDERRTYAELAKNGAALARGLKTLGVRRGDKFAIMMQNHPEFVEAMIAASELGAIFIPIDARSMGEKLQYMLAHSECRGVVCADYCADTLVDVAPNLPGMEWLIVTGALPKKDATPLVIRSYHDVLSDVASPHIRDAIDPNTPMFMMFTSGTTGNPKAVVQTHSQYMAASKGLHALGVKDDDVLYTGLSLTHINAQGTLRSGLALELPVVVSRKFTKSKLWDVCRAYGCTVFNLLGGMIPEIFSVPPKSDDAQSPVRLVISAGMPVSLWNAYRQRFGIEICEVYGATEGGGAMFNPSGAGPVGSIGRPGAGSEAMTFNENDQPCAAFEAGELRFRRTDGVETVITYYKNDDASRDKVRDGWYRTGDIAHYDENGWFFFHHRVGGGVRRNGDFVNTALVETVISQSRLVADVFVYGVERPSNVVGEKTLVAAVVPSDPSSFHVDSLLQYCRLHLERNDLPEIIQVLDAIPKTVSEKPIERACISLLNAIDIA